MCSSDLGPLGAVSCVPAVDVERQNLNRLALIHREVECCEMRNGSTRVYIHPSSINFIEREYPYPEMLYVRTWR